MAQVTDNYPNKQSVSDQQLKELALQQYKQDEVKAFNFPTEVIDLPSKGKVYPEDNLLASGKIEMKYMTAKEEDILTSANLIKQGVVLDKLFQSLIVSPIKYNDLITGDKNAIMIAARILGYGKEYDVEIECPSCAAKNKLVIDLSTIKDKEIPEEVETVSPNRFKYTLPVSKREVTFKFLTHGDEKKIEYELADIKKRAKKDDVKPELSTRLKHIITSIDGIEDQKAINHFVDNELFAQDSRALRSYVKEISPDTDLTFDFVCNACGHEKENVDIPINVSFFWPSS
jgi:rubredoxin